MRIYLSLILLFAFAACVPSRSGQAGKPGSGASTQVQGGVDVGNMTSSIVAIPHTGASLQYPSNWSKGDQVNAVVLDNKAGSNLRAERADLSEVTSLTALGLQKFLNSKFADRHYSIISINGLDGVRADITSTDSTIVSDIYLISESHEIIHLSAHLQAENQGIKQGLEILNTVRVKYRGVAIVGEKPITVKLTSYGLPDPSHMNAAYTFFGACHTYTECRNGDEQRGSVIFDNGNVENTLGVMGSGGERGRIIDLGDDSSVGFDNVKIEGEYLVAPSKKTLIGDIYTEFTPQDPQADQDELQMQVGHTYLIRHIARPYLDMVTKMHVDHLVNHRELTITYQKLVSVPKEDLAQQVAKLDEYTLKFEKPRESGDVILYSRTVYKNYFYSSFNFEYATSGNSHIVNNSWDITYETREAWPNSGWPSLNSNSTSKTYEGLISLPITTSEIGGIVDLTLSNPSLSLDGVTKDMMPGAINGPVRYHRLISNHIYFVYKFDDVGRLTLGGFQVVEIGPDAKWVRLKWRRILLGDAPHLQKWEELEVPNEAQTVQFVGKDYESSGLRAGDVYYPFLGKMASYGDGRNPEIMWYNKSTLAAEVRPWQKENGVFALPVGTDLNSVTREQIESARAQAKDYLDLHVGDVVGCVQETYRTKVIAVFKVEELSAGNLKLNFRTLYRAKNSLIRDDQ